MTESAKSSDKAGPAPATGGALRSGVAGIYDPKWIGVALCYIAAIASLTKYTDIFSLIFFFLCKSYNINFSYFSIKKRNIKF